MSCYFLCYNKFSYKAGDFGLHGQTDTVHQGREDLPAGRENYGGRKKMVACYCIHSLKGRFREKMAFSYKALRPKSSGPFSQTRLHSLTAPHPSQTMPHAKGKCLNVWTHFTFKPEEQNRDPYCLGSGVGNDNRVLH